MLRPPNELRHLLSLFLSGHSIVLLWYFSHGLVYLFDNWLNVNRSFLSIYFGFFCTEQNTFSLRRTIKAGFSNKFWFIKSNLFQQSQEIHPWYCTTLSLKPIGKAILDVLLDIT